MKGIALIQIAQLLSWQSSRHFLFLVYCFPTWNRITWVLFSKLFFLFLFSAYFFVTIQLITSGFRPWHEGLYPRCWSSVLGGALRYSAREKWSLMISKNFYKATPQRSVVFVRLLAGISGTKKQMRSWVLQIWKRSSKPQGWKQGEIVSLIWFTKVQCSCFLNSEALLIFLSLVLRRTQWVMLLLWNLMLHHIFPTCMAEFYLSP